MYKYSNLTMAHIAANQIMADVQLCVLDYTKKHSDNVELMKQLAIVDKLEPLWRNGRYVSFIRTLRKLRNVLVSYDRTPSTLRDNLLETICRSEEEILAHDETLYEYLSCRSDGSFNESNRLGLWCKLRKEISDSDYYAYADAPESLRNLFSSYCFGTHTKPYFLTMIADALDFTDKLLEYEENDYWPQINEIKNTLEKIGVFDRWRKL